MHSKIMAEAGRVGSDTQANCFVLFFKITPCTFFLCSAMSGSPGLSGLNNDGFHVQINELNKLTPTLKRALALSMSVLELSVISLVMSVL